MALTKATNRMIEGASVNVKDLGATGDGVTDDTVAIQAAIDAVNTTGGGVIYFPAGTYNVKKQAALDRTDYPGIVGPATKIGACLEMKDNIKLEGDGFHSIIDVVDASVTSDYWSISIFGTATDTKIDNWEMTSLRFKGDAGSDKYKLIILEQFSNLNIHHCNLYKANGCRLGYSDQAIVHNILNFTNNLIEDTGTCLGLFYVHHIVINDNLVVESGNGAELVDMQAGCQYAVVSGNHIYVSVGDAGVELNGAKDITVSSNTIIVAGSNHEGVLVNNKLVPPDHATPTVDSSDRITIDGNTINVTGAGAGCAGVFVRPSVVDSTTEISSIIVSNNNISGSAGSGSKGINLGGTGFVCSGNIISNFEDGIIFDQSDVNQESPSETVINGNKISACNDKGGTGNGTGIELRITRSVIVSDNYLYECGNGSGGTDYAIYFYSLDSSSTYFRSISGNTIQTATTGIKISGTITGELHIKDNAIQNVTTPFSIPSDLVNVRGESESVYFGSFSAGSGDDKPVMAAVKNCIITNWYLTNADAITTDGTDYSEYTLRKVSAGSATNISNEGTNDVTFLWNTPIRMDSGFPNTYANAFIEAGDAVVLQKADSGAGQPCADMVCTIEYITY